MTTTTSNQRLGIDVEQRGRVLFARLQGGPRGEFGREIAADLATLVARAESDESVGAVVITGTAAPSRLIASRKAAGSTVRTAAGPTTVKAPSMASSGRWSNQLIAAS